MKMAKQIFYDTHGQPIDQQQVKIFDTTLRDGEQTPGRAMSPEEKLKMARVLEELLVDVIEAGFAQSSDGDRKAIRMVAEAMQYPTVASLARAVPGDIEEAARSVEKAIKPRIHTFIATSDIHMKHKLRRSPAEV